MKTGSSWLRLHFSLISLSHTTLMRSHCRPFMCLATRYSMVWREMGRECACVLGLAVKFCCMYYRVGRSRSAGTQLLLCATLMGECVCFFSVSVGYEYESCPGVIQWERRTALMQGFELVPSNLGGWSLDKHHALNIRSGESTQCTAFVSVCDYFVLHTV